jgi:hypothetical protein
MVQGQLRQIILKPLSQVYQTCKRTGEVYHAIEHMLSKCNTTSKKPSTHKTTKPDARMLGTKHCSVRWSDFAFPISLCNLIIALT